VGLTNTQLASQAIKLLGSGCFQGR